jgi:hypothetical protein
VLRPTAAFGGFAVTPEVGGKASLIVIWNLQHFRQCSM